MKNILVIQTAFLGDVVLATAVIEKLHTCLPDASISMLVRKGNESLLKNHPFLKKVLVWDKTKNKIPNLLHTISEIRKENFDTVINLQRFFSSGLFTIFSGAKTKIGFDKNPLSFLFTQKVKHVIGDGRHEVARNLELLASVCDTKFTNPKLYPGQENDAKTASYKTEKYVTMAPASVWFTKQLPEEKWVELIRKQDKNLKIFLIGGPGDTSLCERILQTASVTNAVNLCGKLNLLDTASLMRDASMNYVNDSGPLHLASATNAPVTAFFCSTIPAFGFGPLSDNSIIVETHEKLTCRPCGLHGKTACPEGHFLCAKSIGID